MITALRSCVAHGLHGAPGMRGDHPQQQRYPLRRRGGRMEKGVKREGPRQNAQRGFLSTDPERPRHRWTAYGPVLDRTPEGSGKALFAADCIGTDQRVDEQESGWFENELEIAVVVRGKPGGKSHLCPRMVGRNTLARNGILEPFRRKTGGE